MIAVQAARNIAAGEWCLALGGQQRRAAITVGCLVLALSGSALIAGLSAPAVRGDRPVAANPVVVSPVVVHPVPSEERATNAPRGAVADDQPETEIATVRPDEKIDVLAKPGATAAGDGAGDGVKPLAQHPLAQHPLAKPLALKALVQAQGLRDMLTRAVAIRHQIKCLALNIYFEARGEPDAGKRAVGHVVMNRVADPRFPDSACAVIQQGGEWPLHRCQFSWWCDGKSDQPKDQVAWKRSKALARQIYWGDDKDPTHGALWYHADYVAPAWGRVLERATKIGRHIFYQDRQTGVQVAAAYGPAVTR